MNTFTFQYPTKVYFGKGIAIDSLKKELPKYGQNVLFAYGGGSITRNGIYDRVMATLKEAGKTVVEFSGIMSNPIYAKVQEGDSHLQDVNIHIFDFTLDDQDMEEIHQMNRGYGTYDPDDPANETRLRKIKIHE